MSFIPQAITVYVDVNPHELKKIDDQNEQLLALKTWGCSNLVPFCLNPNWHISPYSNNDISNSFLSGFSREPHGTKVLRCCEELCEVLGDLVDFLASIDNEQGNHVDPVLFCPSVKASC